MSEKTKQSEATRQDLQTVLPGGAVWLETNYYGRIERRLTYISHKDAKGRLFISVEKLWSDWRYGFKPDTGTAYHYKNQKMVYATPDEIETEEKKRADLERAERDKQMKQAQEARIISTTQEGVELARQLVGCLTLSEFAELIPLARAILARVDGTK